MLVIIEVLKLFIIINSLNILILTSFGQWYKYMSLWAFIDKTNFVIQFLKCRFMIVKCIIL